MRLIWKLLRSHVSVSQLAGFFLANLCGMVIVLLSVQFYNDVLPVFTGGDSFLKKDYLTVHSGINLFLLEILEFIQNGKNRFIQI